MYVFNAYTLCLPLQMSVDLIRERYCELQHLSLLYSHVSSLLHYTSDTLRCMTEAWEDVLLTMDMKLAKYSTVSPTEYYNYTLLLRFMIFFRL